MPPEGDYSIAVETPSDVSRLSDATTVLQRGSDLRTLPENIWGFLVSDRLPLLQRARQVSVSLRECSRVNASSTTAEADRYAAALRATVCPECKKFINTGLLDRYATLWGTKSLTHKRRRFVTPYLDVSSEAVSRERAALYGLPKIIVAKMAKRFEAFLDEDGTYASANTNVVYDARYDLAYILAILNSSLMSALYGAYFGSLIMGGGYFQFQAPQLRVLPIRVVAFTTQVSARERRAAEANALYERFLSNDADGNSLLTLVEQELSAQPERADVVHDVLSMLARDMTRTCMRIEAEKLAFLTWLEGAIGAQIDDLALKERVRAYDQDGFEVMVRTLRANRRRIAVDARSRRVQESLEPEFNGSVEALRPLKARIAATDRLIDQIVLRLYRLTPEEMEDIEG